MILCLLFPQRLARSFPTFCSPPVVNERDSLLMENVKSLRWQKNTGWHLCEAAVSRCVSDRLQFVDLNEQKHSRTDSALDTSHSINSNHHQSHSHYDSATTTLMEIYSPVFPLQIRTVEPARQYLIFFPFFQPGKNTDTHPHDLTAQMDTQTSISL